MPAHPSTLRLYGATLGVRAVYSVSLSATVDIAYPDGCSHTGLAVYGVAHHIADAVFIIGGPQALGFPVGGDVHRLYRHRRGEVPAVQGVHGAGPAVIRFQRVALFMERQAALQNVQQDKAPILRQFHTGDVRPVEPLTALGGHKGGVYQNGFHAQLRRDLCPYRRGHALVVFV